MWIRPYNLFMSLWYVEFVFARPRFLLVQGFFQLFAQGGGGGGKMRLYG